MSEEKPIIIVSGLPRSGTSLMMQMLHAGGVEAMSDGIRAADVDNPRGYLEFERAKQIEDDPSFLAEAHGKVFKMVSMLLFHLPSEYHYKVIFRLRHLDEVIASQNKMLERLGKPIETNTAKTRRVLEKHLREVKQWLQRRSHYIEVLYVDHHQVLNDPEPQIAAICEFLGEDLDREKMAAAIDPTLYRQRATSR